MSTLTNSLALAVPLLCLINAKDTCISGQLKLRIYSKECEELSVKTKVDDKIHFTECGEAWGAEKGEIDGFAIVGEVPIDITQESANVTFWFNQGPKDHPYEKKTEVNLNVRDQGSTTDLPVYFDFQGGSLYLQSYMEVR
jgi:hypothetical protein